MPRLREDAYECAAVQLVHRIADWTLCVWAHRHQLVERWILYAPFPIHHFESLLILFLVVFFIIFIISPNISRKLWVSLVLYSQAVLLMLFVWQLSWTNATENRHRILEEIVGLSHFNNLWRSTIWNLLIVVFSVIQWNVNSVCALSFLLYRIFANATIQVMKEKMRKKETQLSRATSVQQYPAWTLVLTSALQTAYHNFGLFLCYIAFVLVAIVTHRSIISIIYMVIVFVCWVLHYLFAHPQRHLRRIWLPVVIFNGLVLIAKYVYQFVPVYEFLKRHYHEGSIHFISIIYIIFSKIIYIYLNTPFDCVRSHIGGYRAVLCQVTQWRLQHRATVQGACWRRDNPGALCVPISCVLP